MRTQMMSVLTMVAIGAATAPVAAQTAPSPVSTQVAPTAAPKHYTTADTTVGDLLADPAAKTVVDKHIPGVSTAPRIEMANGMTLRTIQQMSPDDVSEKSVDDIDVDLAKLPPK